MFLVDIGQTPMLPSSAKCVCLAVLGVLLPSACRACDGEPFLEEDGFVLSVACRFGELSYLGSVGRYNINS
jgi:hypothetical protein